MKHDIVSTNYTHSMADMLKSHAILTTLPKNFVMQSSGGKSLMIDPKITADKLIPLIKLRPLRDGWKPVVVLDSTIYFKGKNAILSATFVPGRVDINVQSSDLKAELIVAEVMAPFEQFKFENKEDGGVWVNFSYMNGMNIDRNTQFMRCPKWSEIQQNYPSACQDELNRIMKMKRPWANGRLMIWHGPPGSGKTFGIRALLMAWREQFNFIIVADPEKLMASPSYYYEVASAPNMNAVPGAQTQDDDAENPNHSKKKRLLFIIEDSGDLISTGSRQEHWDKFGKLLNITDGLVGQGREDIFLLTFNEELENIDPAMVRPGRCISELEFEKFSVEEARTWLSNNQVPQFDAEIPLSLAELYQMKSKKGSPVPVSV